MAVFSTYQIVVGIPAVLDSFENSFCVHLHSSLDSLRYFFINILRNPDSLPFRGCCIFHNFCDRLYVRSQVENSFHIVRKANIHCIRVGFHYWATHNQFAFVDKRLNVVIRILCRIQVNGDAQEGRHKSGGEIASSAGWNIDVNWFPLFESAQVDVVGNLPEEIRIQMMILVVNKPASNNVIIFIKSHPHLNHYSSTINRINGGETRLRETFFDRHIQII